MIEISTEQFATLIEEKSRYQSVLNVLESMARKNKDKTLQADDILQIIEANKKQKKLDIVAFE